MSLKRNVSMVLVSLFAFVSLFSPINGMSKIVSADPADVVYFNDFESTDVDAVPANWSGTHKVKAGVGVTASKALLVSGGFAGGGFPVVLEPGKTYKVSADIGLNTTEVNGDTWNGCMLQVIRPTWKVDASDGYPLAAPIIDRIAAANGVNTFAYTAMPADKSFTNKSVQFVAPDYPVGCPDAEKNMRVDILNLTGSALKTSYVDNIKVELVPTIPQVTVVAEVQPTARPLLPPDTTNLLDSIDPTFERNSKGVGNYSGKLVSTVAHAGVRSIQVKATNYFAQFMKEDLKPNTNYKYSAWVLSPAANNNVQLGIHYKALGATVLTDAMIANTFTSSAVWTQYSVNFTTPAEMIKLDAENWYSLSLYSNNTEINVDDMRLEEVIAATPIPTPAATPTAIPGLVYFNDFESTDADTVPVGWSGNHKVKAGVGVGGGKALLSSGTFVGGGFPIDLEAGYTYKVTADVALNANEADGNDWNGLMIQVIKPYWKIEDATTHVPLEAPLLDYTAAENGVDNYSYNTMPVDKSFVTRTITFVAPALPGECPAGDKIRIDILNLVNASALKSGYVDNIKVEKDTTVPMVVVTSEPKPTVRPASTATPIPTATATATPTATPIVKLERPSVSSSVTTATSKVDGSYSVNGAKITLYKGSNSIGSGTVASGKFSITFSKQVPGSTLTLKASKAGSTTSDARSLTVSLQKPTISASSKSVKVKGKSYANSYVSVYLGSKKLGTDKASSNGSYSVSMKSKVAKGKTITVKVTYKSYNSSATYKMK